MSRKGPSSIRTTCRAYALLFAALGDPTRLALVDRLSRGAPCSISQLTRSSRLTRQAITRHLRVLENAGIVRSRRHGRESRFEFHPKPMLDLRSYLRFVSQQWDQSLSRLRSLVETDRP